MPEAVLSPLFSINKCFFVLFLFRLQSLLPPGSQSHCPALSSMDYYTPQSSRRHNPVDSICRKLQTIQWRGDREPNTPFQIPKLSSSSYDSPQCGLRHNLEAILKKSALYRDEGERGKEKKEKVKEKGSGSGMPTSASSQKSSMGPNVPLSTPTNPARNPATPANITYTITSTLGERRGADGSDLRQAKTWQKYCSTPTGQPKDSPYFTFTRGPQSESERPSSSSPPLSRPFTPSLGTLSYNLNFCSAETTSSTECELSYPTLVVKRLSMGDGGREEQSIKHKMINLITKGPFTIFPWSLSHISLSSPVDSLFLFFAEQTGEEWVGLKAVGNNVTGPWI